ncbi:MAG: hypothetical protein NTW80_10245 [Deltaproteobacteria bacterium]|nr:hypothetical protein [Deltaproteobacteria bacterium]
MKKKVLLAIDLEAPASWAASYAVQLAARLAAAQKILKAGQNHLYQVALLEVIPKAEDSWLGRPGLNDAEP